MKKQILANLIAASLVLVTGDAFAENLLQVYQRAKGYDAQFKAQESAHLAVLETKSQALAGFKPQVNLSASGSVGHQYNTVSNNSSDNTNLGYTLSVNKSLYDKSLNANLEKTDALIAQSTASLESYRQDLIIRTASAYFDELLAQDNLEFARTEKQAVGRQLEQTRAYFEAGRSAITDVKEAEASYAATVAKEITAAEQLDVAREALRVLTGAVYQGLNAPAPNTPLNIPAPGKIDAWVNLAKQNNYLIKASKQAILAAQKNIDVQRAAKSPTVDLFANHSGDYNDTAAQSHAKIYGAAVGVQLNMPLYTGGAIESQVRQAQNNFRQAQQTYDLQERQTEQQTRSAFLTVQSSIGQIRANQQALASAQTAAEATQAGFEVGTRTAVDVLNALRNVFSARRDYASARYSYLLNTLLLRQAAGTLGDRDIAAMSAYMTQAPRPAATSTAISQDVPAAEDNTAQLGEGYESYAAPGARDNSAAPEETPPQQQKPKSKGK